MPWRPVARVLKAKAELSVFAMLIGALVGVGVALAFVIIMDSKPPVTIVAARELDGMAQRGGFLEMRFRFLRTQECNSVAGYWLWQMRPDDRGEKIRYVVALGSSQVTFADPLPIVQDFVFAMALPPAVTPGQWFLHMKYLDYCHLLAPVVGPRVRVIEDVPISIVERGK